MGKLTINDKIKIYELWKSGEKGVSELSRLYHLNLSTVVYITRLADRHGVGVFNHEFTDYSPEFKKNAVKRVLLNGETKVSVSIDLGLTTTCQIRDWVNKVKENGYTSLERMRGWQWHEKEDNGGTRERKQGTPREELEAYNRELIRKKIECLSFSKRKIKKEDIAKVITELRQELKCSLVFILDTIKANDKFPQITKSDYYYQLSKTDKDTKNDDIMNRIISIFYEHKQRYGYRRITLQLKKEGFNINDKKVRRLMSRMGLKAKKRNKRRYSSYKGTVGKIADNLIQRDFFANKPNEKWYSDITEFNHFGTKIYLSPILDGYAGDIVSYEISKSPNLKQVTDMVNEAFNKYDDLSNLIFHTDQGWQYQHESYQKLLTDKGVKQSMSRKGNSIDDGLMENFFGLLKTEMYYDQEDEYKTIDDLIKAIEDYIYYYNNDRIKSRLKGLTPIEYRNQALI